MDPTEDPKYLLRICSQIERGRRCRRDGVHHAEPFLDLLGLPWEEFTRSVEVRFKPGMRWDILGEWVLNHRNSQESVPLPEAAEQLQVSSEALRSMVWEKPMRETANNFSYHVDNPARTPKFARRTGREHRANGHGRTSLK
jgi:hypothetical protein